MVKLYASKLFDMREIEGWELCICLVLDIFMKIITNVYVIGSATWDCFCRHVLILFSCTQNAIYLHCNVDARTRLAAWVALSNAHVLELLPSLDSLIAKPEGYLKPLEEDESLLEAFHKSWVNGALDRATNRCSGTYTIALHHLSSFIFSHDNGEKLSLWNKFIKSLLRDYSRKQRHEMMMVDLIRYNYPPNTQMSCENEELSLQSILSKRFHILTEACEGNSSLLPIVERLKSACSRLN